MRETESSRNLYEIAEPQYGFFTTKQAKEAGYDESKHAYHVRAGNWMREHRGIYRLRNFPSPERPDLMLWFLWSRDRNDVPRGVYSHDTALALYDLSDVNPAKLHMTIPKGVPTEFGSSQSPGTPQGGPGANRFSRRAWRARHYGSPDNRRSGRRGKDGRGYSQASSH